MIVNGTWSQLSDDYLATIFTAEDRADALWSAFKDQVRSTGHSTIAEDLRHAWRWFKYGAEA
jgi:hypothetical protein